MAIVDAVASGNYSNYAVTFGGITPQPGDTIRLNAVSITLNIPVTGITFDISNGNGRLFVTQTEITANGGTLTLSDCHFITNHSGNNTNVFQASLSSGKLVITGTITSLNGKFGIINLTGTAEVEVQNVTGTSTYGNSGVLQIIGVSLSNKATVTFCKGGTALASYAVAVSGTLTAYITTAEGGESYRSYGVVLTAATGLVCYVEHSKPSQVSTLSPASPGMLIDSTCINTLCYITNAYGSDGGEGSALNRTAGVWTGSQDTSTQMGNGTRVYIKNLIFGLRGQTPISGTFFIWDTLDATCQYRLAPSGATKTLGNPASFGNAPSANDVRAKVKFNFGNDEGTCFVPAANQTAAGVPVDNTVGTAVLTTAGVASGISSASPAIAEGVWRRLRSADASQAGSYGAVNEWAGNVDAVAIADAVFSASESGPSTGNQWGSTTMGRKLLRSTSTDAAVSVTGNGHVAASVHSMQDDSISATAVSAGAVTKVATGVWSALTSGFSVAGSAGEVVKAIASMLEFVGGLWRWKASSLTEAPTGGGGSGQYAITLVASSTSGNVRGVVFSIVGTATRVETGTTGQAVVNLDAGAYTLRTTPPSGWESVADSALVVAADATVTKTLVAVGYTPSNPPGCTVAIPVRSQYTTALEGVEVKLKFVGWATGATKPATVLSPPPIQTTDASGIVTVVLYRQARYVATYCVDGDQPKVVPFTVPDASTYTVVEE